MPHRKNGILVTGTHRSGTTWMGRILSLPPNVVYVHEPFNRDFCTNSVSFRFERWFTFTEDVIDRAQLYQALSRTLRFRHVPDPPSDLGHLQSLRRNFRKRIENLDHRLHRRLPLIKDPIALLSAEDLATRFNLDVICMIRHPLAFCGSLKKWDWHFPFQDLLAQPVLMERYFSREREQIKHFATHEQPVVHQAVLLWNLFHKVIRGYQTRHPNWIFPRHEDMVADPLARFSEIFKILDIKFTGDVAAALRSSLSASPSEPHALTYRPRNASSVIRTWKSRLTDDEIHFVLNETAELRSHFYQDDPLCAEPAG